MLAHDGYGSRYEKIKSIKRGSVSPSPHAETHSPERKDEGGLGRVVGKLGDRIDGLEIKIVSITNIVKLLQKYSESKDEQYEKQKQNQEFRKNIGQRVGGIESLEIEHKLKQFENLSQRVKSEITAMESLRVGLSRDNSKKTMGFSPEPFTTMQSPPLTTIQSPPFRNMQSPNATVQRQSIMADVEETIVQLECNMRQQINKKMDICLNYLKNVKQSMQQSSPTTVNSIMMQEQMHNLTLTVNKVEADCLRNKMILQKKIQQIATHLVSSRMQDDNSILVLKSSDYYGSRSKSKSTHQKKSRKKSNRNGDDSRSENSSISKRSKSKSKAKESRHVVKSEQVIRIAEQKKVKQNELKQALRKKKDNQEKLRMKK